MERTLYTLSASCLDDHQQIVSMASWGGVDKLFKAVRGYFGGCFSCSFRSRYSASVAAGSSLKRSRQPVQQT